MDDIMQVIQQDIDMQISYYVLIPRAYISVSVDIISIV